MHLCKCTSFIVAAFINNVHITLHRYSTTSDSLPLGSVSYAVISLVFFRVSFVRAEVRCLINFKAVVYAEVWSSIQQTLLVIGG